MFVNRSERELRWEDHPSSLGQWHSIRQIALMTSVPSSSNLSSDALLVRTLLAVALYDSQD